MFLFPYWRQKFTMNRTLFDMPLYLLLLAALVPSFDGQDDEESEPPVEYQYELASSPDAHMVYEDTHYFEIVSPESLSYTYKLRQAKDFGSNFERQYKNIKLIIADPIEACRPIANTVENRVALVLRGGCSFLTKSSFAEMAGALAVIIADSDEDNDEYMVEMVDDETGRDVGIPSLFLMGKDGVMIRRHLMFQDLNEAVINIPINLTGVAIGSVNLPPWTLW